MTDPARVALVDRVLAAAQPELSRLRARARRRRAVVAAFVVTLSGALWLTLRLEQRTVARNGLAARLQADGRFDPASWRGPSSSEVGLQALGVLALARAEDASFGSRRAELLRGAGWLLEQQWPDGGFGAPVSSGPDEAIATLALLETWSVSGDARVLAGARAAVRSLAARARPAGSPWEPAALERAQALGVEPRLAARARQPFGGPNGAALQLAAVDGLGRLPPASFGELPAAAAAVLATTTIAR